MPPAPNTAPWQLAPVSAAGRVVAAALIFLAVDSTFVWNAIPVAASIALVALPLLVAIRVVRGFPNSLAHATTILASYALLVLVALATPFPGRTPLVRAALVVSAVLSVAGFAASAVAWWGQRQRAPAPNKPVIVGQFVHETHDFLRKSPGLG